jgi:hypothetical protein
MSCPLGGPIGSASVAAHALTGQGMSKCCRGNEAPIPCTTVSTNRPKEEWEPLAVSRCMVPLGSERSAHAVWEQSRSGVCGTRYGLDGFNETLTGEPALLYGLVEPGITNQLQRAPAVETHAEPAQGIRISSSFEPTMPFAHDEAAPLNACVVASLQQAQVASDFRRLRGDLESELRAVCGSAGSHFEQSAACVQARGLASTRYTQLQSMLASSTEDVVRSCFPGAHTGTSPLDGLAASIYRLAALPGSASGVEPLGEDARFCSLRGDAARHLCATLPAKLMEPTAVQLEALCRVDILKAMADEPTDPLRAAVNLMHDAARRDTATAPYGASVTARRWCPMMLEAAAKSAESLRARFTENPAIGRADSIMCGNLFAASSCLGVGGTERIGQADWQDDAPGSGDVSTGGDDDRDARDEGQQAKDRPPGDLAAKPNSGTDVYNVFTDVFDKSRSLKAEAVGVLETIASSNLTSSRVERLDANEIPANTGLAQVQQHQNVCFLHCHARDEDFGNGKLLNCRLFTPPEPGTQCQRAVISVADESSFEGRLKDRDGQAYETIRGVLDSFAGCNVQRDGTLNGKPTGALNVRMEPFGAPRWADMQARYGFCYVEREQLQTFVTNAERDERLSKHRQPSGNYTLAFATSKGRMGGRMAQRECKMLLDLQQNVCRHRYSQNLRALPGFTSECSRKDRRVLVDRLGVQVPMEDGQVRTVYIPIYEFPRKSCELRLLAEACGRISSFAQGEPSAPDSRDRFGVPDSNDFHCPEPTAAARSRRHTQPTHPTRPSTVQPHLVRAGSNPSDLFATRQEYQTTVWSEQDRQKRFAKEDLSSGCEATCALYWDYMDPNDRQQFDDCVERCFAEPQV